MKNKKLLSLFLLIPIILLFIILYSKNKNIPITVSRFENFLYKYEDFEEELPVYFSDDCNEYKEKIHLISKSGAIEDINNLFSLLKFGYSGYSFFGGDEKFNYAKNNILTELDMMESKSVPTDLLSSIIRENLDFIQDSHFAIDNQKICEYTRYFSSEDYTFQKDSKGFYTYLYDNIYYLDRVNNNNV